jgi:hypothetical protein
MFSQRGMFCLWDATSGKRIRAFGKYPERFLNVYENAVANNGKFVVASFFDLNNRQAIRECICC